MDFTVLGLLGPAGSGKDVVADWFATKGFVKVAFADPMKRFVLKAFDLETDRLWGPSEKRNEMFNITSESWWFEVIGHFGDAAKEIIQKILPDGLKVEGYLRLHDWLTLLRKTYRDKISARIILQTLGTEWGRSIDPMMWARYAYTVVDTLKQGGLVRYRQDRGIYWLDEGRERTATGVVIPDHRFKNEVECTQEQGGYVLRLKRLSLEKTRPDVGVAGHRSESEQNELPDNLFSAVYELPEGVEVVGDLLESTYEMRPWARKWDRDNALECNIVRWNPDSPAIPAT